MRAWLSTLGVVAQIAFRNLFASRLKTIIVGGIIFFGALLVVVGGAMLDSLVSSMSRSAIGSVVGHIQVYNKQSKDSLEVIGRFMMGDPDLAQLDDFAEVRKTLLKVPNVKSVVPMGISSALVTSGNTIDLTLEKLRNAVRARREAKDDAARARLDARIADEKGHVRQIVSVLQGDLKNAKTILDARAIDKEDLAAVNRAASPGFWADFDKDPYAALEFLENRIANQAVDADLLFLNYVGTDLQVFTKAFDRMKIVDGATVPPGKRGFLFAKHTYEEQIKLKAAHRLDKIKEGIEARRETIATNLELQRLVRENVAQVREIMLQLDGPKTDDFRAKLRRELKSKEADVAKLLAAFFQTDDRNLHARHEFFYRELAPSLEMYRVRIGDVLTIKAFTRSGYVQSVNVPVYGTFEFQGLEKSALAGNLNLMDLVSFRELYGFMSGDRLAEINQLRAQAGAREIKREDAEAELFGSKAADDSASPPRRIEAKAVPPGEPAMRDLDAPLGSRAQRDQARSSVFPPAEVERGVVLNAAVILDNPKKLNETIAAIEAQAAKDGVPLKAIGWQQASGFIGQFIMTAQMVLAIAILIIFLIALVIINNALVMATLERVREIGTLRAIGAQRRFILAMLVLEALVVGFIFGGLGAGVGAAVVGIIGKVGIAAGSDVQVFFFGGPRLYPFLSTGNVIAAVIIVLLASALSSLYPAWLAMRVTPRQAMQEDE